LWIDIILVMEKARGQLFSDPFAGERRIGIVRGRSVVVELKGGGSGALTVDGASAVCGIRIVVKARG